MGTRPENCRTLLKSGEPLTDAHQDQPMMEGKTDIIRNSFNALIEETRRITKGEVLEQIIAKQSFGLLNVRAVAVEERARRAEAEFKSTGSSLEEHMGFKAITRNPKSVLVPKTNARQKAYVEAFERQT